MEGGCSGRGVVGGGRSGGGEGVHLCKAEQNFMLFSEEGSVLDDYSYLLYVLTGKV